MIAIIIKQELSLIFRKSHNIANPIIFFFIAVSIFAISFSNSSGYAIDRQLSIGIIWLCLIFSILLGINHSFKDDFEDGTMEQLLISGYMFELIIASKMLASWLIYCLPLIIAIPIAAIILKLNYDIILHLILISIIATLIINFIASFCAGLILSASSGYSLLTILVLPLAIPVIIFANSAFINFDEDAFYSSCKFLLAILVFLAPILIFATCAAIKLHLDS